MCRAKDFTHVLSKSMLIGPAKSLLVCRGTQFVRASSSSCVECKNTNLKPRSLVKNTSVCLLV